MTVLKCNSKVKLPYSTYGIKDLRNHATWKSVICSPHLIMDDLYSQYLEYYSATLQPQTVKLEFLVINVQKIRIKGPLYLEQDYVTHRSNTEWKETCGLSGHFHLI